MKNKILILCAALACFLYSCESNDSPTSSVYIQKPVNRKVLVEFFTNAGCIPCVQPHNYFDQVSSQSGVTINDSSVITVSYHYRFPDPRDSLYIQNSAQNLERAAFYGINFTPNIFLDGTYMGQYSAFEYTNQLNAEMNTTKYLDIQLVNVFDSTSDSGMVTANIRTLVSPPTSNNYVYIIVKESNINYTLTNGITNFNDVVRRFANGASGVQINLVPGQVVTYSSNYGLAAHWDVEDCEIVVFVQDDSKKVYGVEEVKVK
jgi:hypothetical protein